MQGGAVLPLRRRDLFQAQRTVQTQPNQKSYRYIAVRSSAP
jgi:hypothetical protein